MLVCWFHTAANAEANSSKIALLNELEEDVSAIPKSEANGWREWTLSP